MKKWNPLFLPPLLGLVGAALRFIQCRTVFEPDTLLARPHIISTVLPIYLALCAVFFLISAGKSEKGLTFDSAFTVPTLQILTTFVFSAMLLIVAGGYTILTNLGGGLLPMLLGGAAAVAGACLFLGLYGWRKENISGTLFLMPVFFGILWLFITYQEYASWPVMTTYFVQVLAIAAITYAFFQVAACAHGQGNRRMLGFILPTAIVLAFTALGDSAALPVKGMYLASLATLYGFFLCLNHENK